MTTVTHSVIDEETYSLAAHEQVVGWAKRLEKGFLFEDLYGEQSEHPTMKALKEAVENLVATWHGLVERATRKPFYITVDDARLECGISHTTTNYYVAFLHRAYPWLRKHQLGAAICYFVKSERAKWDHPRYDCDREWLISHRDIIPRLPELDWDAFNAYPSRIVYKTKP
jgi:hypothetical protein